MADAPLPILSALQRAQLALDVLVLDGAALGGLWLRARVGPARAAVLGRLAALALPARRIHPSIDDGALFGGTDLAASLSAGAHRKTAGVLDAPSALILTMAERAPAGLAARLALHLDAGTSCLIALDEGAEAEEALAPALAERLALFLDLSDFALDNAEALQSASDLAPARARLTQLRASGLPPQAMAALAGAADSLGIYSLRAPLMAARAALAIAALRGLDAPNDSCLQDAASLVYAQRATLFPDTPAEDAPPPDAPPPPEAPNDLPDDAPSEAPQDLADLPQDMVLEAVRAALPPDVLARLAAGRAARSMKGGAGTGAKIKGNHRGRPLPARAGRMGHGKRIDILATLRTAAPMQRLRGAGLASNAAPTRLAIRPSDLRIKRYQHSSDRVLIFTVDASGSSAFARLAEAKGAVELLLAQSYARRDHVALLAFRGQGCEVVLPPTRSLTATKRRLAGLAGGGGTPLAAGLRMGLDLALQTRARGMTPTLALLTDGRGNIALDGSANRAAAEQDAQRLARVFAATGIPALVIDIATRPQPSLAGLARDMRATYLPLPRADSQRLSQVLQAGMGG
jgi:magnesium chelatase subunit D